MIDPDSPPRDLGTLLVSDVVTNPKAPPVSPLPKLSLSPLPPSPLLCDCSAPLYLSSAARLAPLSSSFPRPHRRFLPSSLFNSVSLLTPRAVRLRRTLAYFPFLIRPSARRSKRDPGRLISRAPRSGRPRPRSSRCIRFPSAGSEYTSFDPHPTIVQARRTERQSAGTDTSPRKRLDTRRDGDGGPWRTSPSGR